MPAPQVSVSFSSQVGALNQQEIERRAREARMQNALEILAQIHTPDEPALRILARFVRRTAREGLGRERERYTHDNRVKFSDVGPHDDDA